MALVTSPRSARPPCRPVRHRCEALLAGILLARSLQYAHDRYEANYAAYLGMLDEYTFAND